MSIEPVPPSRRRFVTQLGRIASIAAVGSVVSSRVAGATETSRSDRHAAEDHTPEDHAPGDFDLSWVSKLDGTVNRGVFDWSKIEPPPESTPLDYAARYLDGCAAAYGDAAPARAVIVIRHEAIPAALDDAAWKRYDLGAANEVTDPVTHRPATRNPFWSGDSHDADAPPTLQQLVGRGAIVLACNLALKHTAERLARAHGESPDAVHRALVGSLVPNAFTVPSGIWGLVRAQNAGCGLIRV